MRNDISAATTWVGEAAAYTHLRQHRRHAAEFGPAGLADAVHHSGALARAEGFEGV